MMLFFNICTFITTILSMGEEIMADVSVTELRNRLPLYLGRVKAGEEILVTS